MNFSPFEVIMLVCFGLSWPFSIYRTFKSKSVEAKSPVFLILVAIGYVAGVVHKVLYRPDVVVYLYAANGLMVSFDLFLVLRNRRRMRSQE